MSGYAALQFRASVNFTDDRNVGDPQDLTVTLTDTGGNSAAARASDWSGALFFPPGRLDVATRAVPKIVLNAIRIPLTQFAGIDLTRVQYVQFQFDQRDSGAFLFSDLAFVD